MKSKQARFIDYPEGEYTQASGNGEYRSVWYAGKDIVRTAWGHADAYNGNSIVKAGKVLRTLLNGSDYQQFFKTIMQDKVIRFERPVIVIAHTLDVYDETTLSMKTSVPVKGALKGVGIESYFSTVVGAKRMSTKELAAYANPHLKITPQEASLEFKYVFQTLPTKKTTGERIRSPMGMFTSEETFIDNCAQMLLDFLKEYYK